MHSVVLYWQRVLFVVWRDGIFIHENEANFLCKYIFKIVCNYENYLVFSLNHLNFLFILTRIALLVCSEILITLGHNGGELLFTGKECNKVSFLLTTPSTVMESPFFTLEIAQAPCL